MQEVFRIFELRHGILTELAFVKGEQSAKFYLYSCNSHNTDENVCYFAQKLKIEQ